jgi:hypothetical protein
VIPPTTWLWSEIERRFGQEAAEHLRHDFNEQMKRYEREQQLQRYREELPLLEAQLERAQSERRATKRIENKIKHRRARLQKGWGTSNGQVNTV